MEPPSRRRVGVINRSGLKLAISPIQKAAQIALARQPQAEGEVTILLTDDDEVRQLNRQYRGIDEATDVLTFPTAPLPGGASTEPRLPNAEGRMPNAPLGDIAIAVPYAKRQAQLRGVMLDHELQYLAIHGVLHLLGYNDETSEDRDRMFAEMHAVGQDAGLPPDREWASILHGEKR